MENKQLRIAIIGAGPAGLAAGHELLEQGFVDFTIFEKQDAPGGTWHLHSYPGLACDLWAHSYTFSYRPNPDWSANFVDQPEIDAYLQQCAKEFGLEPHLQLNTEIVAARYSADKRWCVTTATGEQLGFDVIINAMGGQHTPVFPEVPGIDSFQGDAWHSTHWNHDVPLTGKRVVIVGSAAAAVQIVPKVAQVAGTLTVLQRTPNWIMPRNHGTYSPVMRTLFKRVPGFVRVWRAAQGVLMSAILDGVTLEHARMRQFEQRVHKFIDQTIDDPDLRQAVTPRSRYGCKRGLVSDEFYPTLTEDHVTLIAEGLQSVTSSGIVTTGGREIDADVIVYCTGYTVLDYDRIEVIGPDHRVLGDEMTRAPLAYKGIAAPGFPNYFFAAGPNGLAINVSFFTNVERNAKTIVTLLSDMLNRGVSSIDVRQDATDRYNADLSGRFDRYSWGHGSCNSYYRTASGHAPFLFPGGYKQYDAFHELTTLDDFNQA